jgi:hypothetical protein
MSNHFHWNLRFSHRTVHSNWMNADCFDPPRLWEICRSIFLLGFVISLCDLELRELSSRKSISPLPPMCLSERNQPGIPQAICHWWEINRIGNYLSLRFCEQRHRKKEHFREFYQTRPRIQCPSFFHPWTEPPSKLSSAAFLLLYSQQIKSSACPEVKCVLTDQVLTVAGLLEDFVAFRNWDRFCRNSELVN